MHSSNGLCEAGCSKNAGRVIELRNRRIVVIRINRGRKGENASYSGESRLVRRLKEGSSVVPVKARV
jgi:hypothetical protein